LSVIFIIIGWYSLLQLCCVLDILIHLCLIFPILYLFIGIREYKKSLEVDVCPLSGMIWDNMEGGKPESGDGSIHLCDDVSSMGCLTYYYHRNYPSGLSLPVKGCFYA
jgi:hypothetical protein